MKKIFVICLLLLMVLTGCVSRDENEAKSVKVLIPSGGPALGFVQLIHEEKEISGLNVTYEVQSGVDDLTAAMTSKSHEIVIAPTNLGANLYNKGSGYQYAATISFGNLFLVGKEGSTNLEGKTIAVFGKNTTPDIIFRKILEEKGLLDKVTLEYFDSVNDVNMQFIQGKYQYALLAEPVLSVTKTKTTTIEVMNIQTEYQNLFNDERYSQAAIFISKDFTKNNKTFVKEFLKTVKTGILYVNQNNESAANFYIEEELIPVLPKPVIIGSLPNLNLDYESVEVSKEKVNNYLQMIYDFNPAAVGGKMPDDGFYLEGMND